MAKWTPGPDGCKMDRHGTSDIRVYLDSIRTLCQISQTRMEITRVDPYPNPEGRIDVHKRIPIGDQEVFGRGFMRRAGAMSLDGYDQVLDQLGRLKHVRRLLREGISPAIQGNLEQIMADMSISTLDNAPQGLEPARLDEPPGMASYYFVLGRQRFRRAVMTKMRFVGTAPTHAQEGDIFVIFPGAKIPYILREEEEGRSGLIGEGYVHGVMYGDFFLEEEGREVPSVGEFLLK